LEHKNIFVAGRSRVYPHAPGPENSQWAMWAVDPGPAIGQIKYWIILVIQI